TVITMFTVFALGYLVVSRRPWAAAFLLTSVGGATIAMTLLKIFFERPRPTIVPHLSVVADASFPSGHSMISAVFYLTVSAMLARVIERKPVKIYLISGAVILSILIGLTRIYLGVHYPTDVLAGWCMGTA